MNINFHFYGKRISRDIIAESNSNYVSLYNKQTVLQRLSFTSHSHHQFMRDSIASPTFTAINNKDFYA